MHRLKIMDGHQDRSGYVTFHCYITVILKIKYDLVDLESKVKSSGSKKIKKIKLGEKRNIYYGNVSNKLFHETLFKS